MNELQRIALLMRQDIGYCRGVLRGIHTYAIQKPNWVFHDAPPEMAVLGPLRQWQPHGIIALLYDHQFARRVLAMRRPLVNTTNSLLDLKAPLVEADHFVVGRLAAEHFLERGFQNFGYYGSAWTGFSKQREESFRSALATTGHTVASCHAEYLPRPPANTSWKNTDLKVRNWLLALPKPAAILASNDVAARHLAEMCRQVGLRVPEEVALLGVDNDEMECLLCTPPLSSVVNPAEQIGYEAARLLDQLLNGHQPAQTAIFIPPTHVITRASTDVAAVADADVVAALAFIRLHLDGPISVATVAAHVSTSRRGLERRFHRCLGRSILREIQRARIERVKRLLAETDLPMPEIARRCGFSTPQRLAVVFRQTAGVTPTAYRRSVLLRT